MKKLLALLLLGVCLSGCATGKWFWQKDFDKMQGSKNDHNVAEPGYMRK